MSARPTRPMRESFVAWGSVVFVIAALVLFVIGCAYWFGTLS